LATAETKQTVPKKAIGDIESPRNWCFRSRIVNSPPIASTIPCTSIVLR